MSGVGIWWKNILSIENSRGEERWRGRVMGKITLGFVSYGKGFVFYFECDGSYLRIWNRGGIWFDLYFRWIILVVGREIDCSELRVEVRKLVRKWW